MNPEEIITILNAREHRCLEWSYFEHQVGCLWVLGYKPGQPEVLFTLLEAQAIAASYKYFNYSLKWADIEPAFAK